MQHTNASIFSLFLVVSVASAAGCGGSVYQPSRSFAFDPHPEREIDDEAIAAALNARPQLPSSSRIAYFNLAAERDDDIGAMLGELPNVADSYRVPELMVTGRRRFESSSAAASELSVRRLRLLAARAQCDLLVVFDYGYRVEQTPNGWVALSVLVVPTFFTPFLDTEAESYLDAYVIDVRNGYLYGHLSEVMTDERGEETIWSNAQTEIVEAQWSRLLTGTRERLETVLAEPASSATRQAYPPN